MVELGTEECVEYQSARSGSPGHLRPKRLAVIVVADPLPAVERLQLHRPGIIKGVSRLDARLVVGRELAHPAPGVIPVGLAGETFETDVARVNSALDHQAPADRDLR